MAQANEGSNPPVLDDHINYEDWTKDLNVWKLFTNTPAAKQGPRLYLSLKGTAKTLARKIPIEQISADTGFNTIIAKLDEHFKKDKTQLAYIKLEEFETYRRKPDTSIKEYIQQFEELNEKIIEYDMKLPDGVVAYKLLHHANLGTTELNLIKATMSELTYKEIKDKLQKIFTDETRLPIKNEPVIKLEKPLFNNETKTTEETYFLRGGYRSSNNYRGRIANRGDSYRSRGNEQRSYNYRGRDTEQRISNFRGRNTEQRGKSFNQTQSTRKLNPPDENGQPSKCLICNSIFHWAKNCPDAYENQKYSNKVNFVEKEEDQKPDKTWLPMFLRTQVDVNEIKIFKSDEVEEQKELQILLGEALSSAIIDSGAPENVCGRIWLDDYLGKLNSEELKLVTWNSCKKKYKFGHNEPITATKSVQFPTKIASKDVLLKTDVVEVEIPLLLSKAALKKASAKMNFENDTIELWGKEENLLESSCGHYMIPILNHTESKNKTEMKISYNIIQEKDDVMKKAMKIHKHFSHANKKRIQKIIEEAGIWSEEMNQALDEIERTCKECKIYSKPPLKPAVGMSLSRSFNDLISMDLKDYNHKGRKYKLLHIIDNCTRFSQCVRISSKTKEVVLEAIIKCWIQVFGPPRKILTDNGGEFLNEEFLELCDKMNINMKMTAAEAPWSNGMIERHHKVICDVLNKTLEEIEDFDIALAWATQAKNSLYNFHGFSPFTLVFGMNPKIPNTIDSSLPAQENITTSELLEKHLNLMHQTRAAFIKSESEEKIKRALRRNVSSSVNKRFFTGDKVYIKRNKDDRWSGPGTVVGQENQQILVRIGGFYYRMHPCRVISVEESNELMVKNDTNENKTRENNEKEIIEQENVEDLFENIEQIPENNENLQENENNETVGQTPNRRQRFPRIGIKINYKIGEEDWKQGEVRSKVNLYQDDHMYNINTTENENIQLDFKNQVKAWKPLTEEQENETLFNKRERGSYQMKTEEIFLSASLDKEKITEAKLEEIESWRRNNVFEEINDIGQDRVSVKWIVKEKIKNNMRKYKARLVARGYEELDEPRSDSPTCSKDTIRIVLSIAAAKNWPIKAIDIKTAFLQSNPIQREVLLKPPTEANAPNKLWKLRTCIYGLHDASRSWFVSVRTELKSLGADTVKGDPTFYYWKLKGQLIGILCSHVDDFLYTGNKDYEQVIRRIKQKFEISSEDAEAFKYLGIDLQSHRDGFSINQIKYIQTLEPIEITEKRKQNQNDPLNKSEIKSLRSLIGKLNWVTTQTRPDIAFDLRVLASRMHEGTVKDIVEANKLLKRTKSEEVLIKFPKLKNLEQCKLVVYSDSSYANLKDCGSQGARVIFLVDEENKAALLNWNSKRLRRVVRSTLTSETLALSDAVDTAYMLNHMISQLIFNDERKLKIHCMVDSRSLVENVRTSHTLEEKRLLVDMAALRESKDNEEIEIEWIETKENLANPLTKKSAYTGKLLEVMRNGSLLPQ